LDFSISLQKFIAGTFLIRHGFHPVDNLQQIPGKDTVPSGPPGRLALRSVSARKDLNLRPKPRMQKGIFGQNYSSLIYLFLGLSSLIFACQHFLNPSSINFTVLQLGNLLLFVIGWMSLRMSLQALHHKNVQVFLRLVYGSFLMKFFVLAIAACIYIFLYKKNINKPALFGCFGLYFFYMFMELRTVMKQSKNTNA
jgi:hypothetical protein